LRRTEQKKAYKPSPGNNERSIEVKLEKTKRQIILPRRGK